MALTFDSLKHYDIEKHNGFCQLLSMLKKIYTFSTRLAQTITDYSPEFIADVWHWRYLKTTLKEAARIFTKDKLSAKIAGSLKSNNIQGSVVNPNTQHGREQTLELRKCSQDPSLADNCYLWIAHRTEDRWSHLEFVDKLIEEADNEIAVYRARHNDVDEEIDPSRTCS